MTIRRGDIMQSSNPEATQRGTTLIITLLMLVAMTLLALSAVRGGTQEELVARAARNAGIAFEAANAAVEDGAREILGKDTGGTDRAEIFVHGANSVSTTMDCSKSSPGKKGICSANDHSATTPSWRLHMATAGIQRGTYARFGGAAAPAFPTGAGPASVAQQPRYIVEWNVGGTMDATEQGKFENGMFRITGQGFGATIEATSWVQQTVVPQ